MRFILEETEDYKAHKAVFSFAELISRVVVTRNTPWYAVRGLHDYPIYAELVVE